MSEHAELYSISYSPWSERARWALDHHAVSYQVRQFKPMLSQPGLRLRLRRFTGPISAPLLIAGDDVITDSFQIARHAERVGSGSPLFPPGADDAIAGWNARSDTILAAGRVAGLARVRADPEAQRESLIGAVPRSMVGTLRPLAALGVAYLLRKYHRDQPVDIESSRATMAPALSELSDALGDRDTLLDQFSYADITMATALQLVRPVDDRYIRMRPAMRRAAGDDELAGEFAHLIAWRDRVYDRYR